ncbi:MAG: hypoxanthine-guanine phosphoribosyltransferase [Burkholderiales bacterium]
MTPAEAWKILEEAELIRDESIVRDSIARIAAEITHVLSEANPLVISIMRGGVFLTGQLLPLLRFPLELECAQTARYGNATVGGSLHWTMPPPPSVKNREVLVIDDILDAGETLHAVRDEVMRLGAASCHMAVLADKDLGREKPVKANFVGLSVPNRYLFGCGLDVRGAWRNLPAIYALKDH